ncbi:type III pantothenate kinase [Sulfurimonas marina]|uniref:Type III pantothenate kinase n=1 Tax=Sulfurimonas marina TaxID=2590551 RepID=A0A7M1AUI7_9BACT|nr:type III pantothenate kinase [Sulfurimonas marina]QOP41085.1 type III pantothenate kinase [Sulfurimonas marina]
MLLCDIGNTSYHFNDGKKDFKEFADSFNPQTIKENVYYISVNQSVKEKLGSLENWIDLETFVDREKYYTTMGIDRIVALASINDGVVVDAGSAITVDVLKDGVFEGGFIYPGIKAMQECYKNISNALDYSFNFEVDLGKMAKNSPDAISYGYLKPFVNEIKSKNLPIILTGGDASEFKKLFPNARLDQELIFTGMKKIMKKAGLC